MKWLAFNCDLGIWAFAIGVMMTQSSEWAKLDRGTRPHLIMAIGPFMMAIGPYAREVV